MRDTPTFIRETFLDFYRGKDHRVIKSAPLVPKDDPTLLFTSAGMVQFKKLYSGAVPLEYTRAASVQKCFRASDLENIGFTPRHLTFFEMLGHFSFGDYFKREAIAWNWEFFTVLLRLPQDMLKVSVFEEDDEAFAIWEKEIGIPRDRIYRLGKKDNFWGPAGDTGACGPNTEVYYDLGAELGCGREDCGPGCDCDRWIEIGNVVFPQYDMQLDGTLAPLKNRGIDTGLGLERIAMVLEGKRTLFESGAFRPIVARVEEMSGRKYEGALRSSMNIIADHVRGLTFAMAEGVTPGNEGRGYVIRRILRRAAVQGHRLGLTKPFLADLSGLVVEMMAGTYPELREAAPAVRMGLLLEEERFGATIVQGLSRFEEVAARHATSGTVPGEEIFLLSDTYGFPTDLTALLARERGMEADLDGFERAMAEQRERSRKSARFSQAAGESLSWRVLSEGTHSVFRGHETMELEVRIRLVAEMPREVAAAADAANSAAGGSGGAAAAGGAAAPVTYWVVLDETPFYAESGGQVGDVGVIEGGGLVARVLDTVRHGEEIRHRVELEAGDFHDGPLMARLDSAARRDSQRNHTATHLLQAALRCVLGAHVQQAGSLVAPDRLRFDFTHPRALTADEITAVEEIVNERILRDDLVEVSESSYDTALAEGVTALFGEKYGDRVRRVEVGEFSRELCGGTHVRRTGEIGAFLLGAESGIAAGTRRIEALTGRGTVREARRALHTVGLLTRTLPGAGGVPERVESLQQELAKLRKQVQELRSRGPDEAIGTLFAGALSLPAGRCLVGTLEVEEGADLRALGDRLRGQLGTGAALVAVNAGKKVTLLAVVSDDLVTAGAVRADDIVRAAAAAVGGSGGGKAHLAMAGVGDPTRVDEAMAAGRAKLALVLGG
jgi:alanyl-tRNA synthetase